MGIDSQTMQQMLMQKLQQGPQAGSAGGGAGGPQMQGSISPVNGAAQLMQKVMLMRALQAPQHQQQQAQSMLPGTQAQIANDPTMQALQQQQLAPLTMGQPAMPPPNSMPTPGYS